MAEGGLKTSNQMMRFLASKVRSMAVKLANNHVVPQKNTPGSSSSPISPAMARSFSSAKVARAAKVMCISKARAIARRANTRKAARAKAVNFLFELRSIADAALVGYPNAGKSTLIQRISAARSKIAPYPFTTLHPVIGIVELGDYQRATVADIPGLIEGAHRNLGLGHDFLRHITRCGLLLFVLDMAGSEGRSPIADLESLRREIHLYAPRLSERPWFIVANKMDLPEAEENLRDFQKRFPQRTIVVISAKEGRGINELKRLLKEWMDQHSELVTGQSPAGGRTD